MKADEVILEEVANKNASEKSENPAQIRPVEILPVQEKVKENHTPDPKEELAISITEAPVAIVETKPDVLTQPQTES